MFNRLVKSRRVGQRAVKGMKDRDDQIDALTPLAVSVRAAQKVQQAIKDGVDKATENDAKPLVRVAKDGGHNDAMQNAGESQRRDDATVPKGPDLTRDTMRVGQYVNQVKDEHEGVPDVTRLDERSVQNYRGSIGDATPASGLKRAGILKQDAAAAGTADNPKKGRTVVKDIVYDEYSRRNTAQGRGP